MCTFIGQILYGSAMFIGLALTLTASLFTSEWSKLTNATNGNAVDQHGLLDFRCKLSDFNDCWSHFGDQDTWRKVVIASLLIAIAFEIISLLWVVCTVFTCCFRRHLLHPLAPFAFFASASLIVALAVFFAHYTEDSNIPVTPAPVPAGGFVQWPKFQELSSPPLIGAVLSCAHRSRPSHHYKPSTHHHHFHSSAPAWTVT
ncbi:hypothetical protein M3Y99_01897900 [Aphelenchoides fujianensis]|nr:hypothetical protein M3Y99_01897900 [Aphelenchoides fujianensis]